MSRNYQFAKTLLALLSLLTLLAFPTLAQGKKELNRKLNAAEIRILEVFKDNAAKRRNPNGSGILIPVKVKWQIALPDNVKSWDVKAHLQTINTDKSVTKIEPVLTIDGQLARNTPVLRNDVLDLPMPDNVFALDFVLRITVTCKITENGKERAIESTPALLRGRFPLPPEATKR